MVLSGADAAVILLKGTNTALAVKTDCNGRYVYLNPRLGAQIAVAEGARNVACTGAIPLAVTNCLNFGNPYKPEVYWQFAEAVAGMGEACRVFNTPVTGGNVSFYNESPTTSVFPTPVIGMLGLIEDIGDITTASFKEAGDAVLLLGRNNGHMGGSEYLARIHGLTKGDAPPIDLGFERTLQQCLTGLIRKRLVHSAHDCSEGGLAIALAECCMVDDGKEPIGAQIRLDWGQQRKDAVLFGEDQSRIVITVPSERASEAIAHATMLGIPAAAIGTVGGESLIIEGCIELNVEVLQEVYNGALSAALAE